MLALYPETLLNLFIGSNIFEISIALLAEIKKLNCKIYIKLQRTLHSQNSLDKELD